jgi:hypothetical protein
MLPKALRDHQIFKDGKFIQILILSFSFMLLFTAFQTTCFIEVRQIIYFYFHEILQNSFNF